MSNPRNMTDSFGRLLATTAPCAPMVRGEALRLRCAPATDVGLAVCALCPGCMDCDETVVMVCHSMSHIVCHGHI